jgi:uncharacterized protein YceH (UPF0502 family)
MELTAAEGRVLGCLIEKAATDPDAYPVSLNTLRLACNQVEGRQPVIAYDDRTVEEAAWLLKSKGLARDTPSGRHDRSARYSHRADVRWRMGPAELAVLSVLLVGGAQTLGAVQARAARLHPFEDAGEVEAVLDALAARTPNPFAARLDSPSAGPRARWVQVLAVGPPGDQPAFPDDDLDLDDRSGRAAGNGRPGRSGRGRGGRADVVGADRSPHAPTYAELADRVAELERRLAAASATERPASSGPTRPRHAVDGGGTDWRDTPTPPALWDDAAAATPADAEAVVGLADRLAAIERRVARIEADLGALR